MYQLPPLPVKKKPRPAYHQPDKVKETEQAIFEDDCRKHPNVDSKFIARRKLRDDTAGGLTKCVIFYITLKGGFCSRVNTTGIYDAKLKRYRYTTQKRGLADVIGTYQGKSLQVEVKVSRDKLSPQQEKIRDEQQRAGGLWYEARNFTDFKTWFDGLK